MITVASNLGILIGNTDLNFVSFRDVLRSFTNVSYKMSRYFSNPLFHLHLNLWGTHLLSRFAPWRMTMTTSIFEAETWDKLYEN